MKIEQYFERNGIRLRVTIESVDLPTHSMMQSLRAPLIEAIKHDLGQVLKDVTDDITESLNNAPNTIVGR